MTEGRERGAMAETSPAPFAWRVAETLDGLEGVIGLFAKDLGTGRELAYNPHDVFPTASTLKVPLLYELYRQVDAGEVDLKQRITIEAKDRVPGSGVLQEFDPGLAPTVRDLAELMIIVSDNIATDLLMNLVGKDKLAATVAALDLRQTAIPLTVREMFCAFAGPLLEPGATYDAIKDLLKRDAQDPERFTYTTDPAGPGNDVSSPADMVRLLELIECDHRLTDGSRASMVAMLKRQRVHTIIPSRLPAGTEVAHKGGSIKGVRNDVGIVYAPRGPYAIAIMSRNLRDVSDAIDRLARLSFIVWEEFTKPPRD